MEYMKNGSLNKLYEEENSIEEMGQQRGNSVNLLILRYDVGWLGSTTSFLKSEYVTIELFFGSSIKSSSITS